MSLRDIAASKNPLAELVRFALTEKQLPVNNASIAHYSSMLAAAVEADTGGTVSEDMQPFIDSLTEAEKFPAAVEALGSYIGASSGEVRQFLNIADSAVAIRGGADPSAVEENLTTLLEEEPPTAPEAYAHFDAESREQRIAQEERMRAPDPDRPEPDHRLDETDTSDATSEEPARHET
ncbi:MAG: hypothetical protein VX941_08620 [Pseudomonadota bacterium]|nr:hypothetical protein [Pseudomonadota bacterium]